LIAIKVALHLDIPVYLEEECLGGMAMLVIGYVWVENKDSRQKETEITSGLGELGFIFDIIDTLNRVQYAPRDDERIAELANHIVRADLDKFCIGYRSYKEWRQKNPLIFSAVTYDEEIIGFFDIFPLHEVAAERILAGRTKENRLRREDIVASRDAASAQNIYIASLMFNRHQTKVSAIVAREIMVIKIYEHIMERYLPLGGKRFIAYAHTESGERLLIRAGFKMVSRANDNVQKRGLYVLEEKEVGVAQSRYERILGQLRASKGMEGRSRPSEV
jgi:hypothetical protein